MSGLGAARREVDEPLAGRPGPSEAEALASASGWEKDVALSMPKDATQDVWMAEGEAGRGPGRGERGVACS